MSRQQLYAMGEPLGDSATRAKPGGRIYGSGGGAGDAGGAMTNGGTGLPTSVRTNPAAQQFNPLTAFRMGQSPGAMPAMSIAPAQPTGLLGRQPMASFQQAQPMMSHPAPAPAPVAQNMAQPDWFKKYQEDLTNPDYMRGDN